MVARPQYIIPQSWFIRSCAAHYLDEQRRLQERMERDPSGFLALELSHALRTGTVAIEASVAFLISDPVEIINAVAD